MRRQQFADFLNPFDQRVAEFLVLKMLPHFIHNALPELLAAFFVNRFISNNSELACARRYENQHRIALACFVHAEALKFLLCSNQGIRIQLAALNINANLARSFRFSFTNRAYNLFMLKLAEKLTGSHFTNSILRLRRRNSRLHR